MDWTDVKKLLLAEVIPLMSDADHGKKWLSALETCPDGERLGLCMAIDACSGAVDPSVFAAIITETDVSADVREHFGMLVNHPPNCHQYVCASNFQPVPLNSDDSYVRIMELGDFAKFLNRGYTRARSHIRRVRSMYFQPRDDVELGHLRNWVRGRLPNVWVTSFDDLSELLNPKHCKDPGTMAYDSLGLLINNGVAGGKNPELVGVRYPPEFDKVIACTQPTTLDAWWVDAGWNFLSSGNMDSWGRTRSLTDKGMSQKERVHSLFKNLTPGYRTYYIGVAKRPGKPGKMLPLDYLRLENAGCYDDGR